VAIPFPQANRPTSILPYHNQKPLGV